MKVCSLFLISIKFSYSGKFQKYRIKWSKFDPERKKWIQIFNYYVSDPDRQTSLLYTMKVENDNDFFEKGRRFRARDRYRSYDKAYYGDDFTGSHVLEIERITPADLGTYKIEMYVPGSNVGNQANIELRHEGERFEYWPAVLTFRRRPKICY